MKIVIAFLLAAFAVPLFSAAPITNAFFAMETGIHGPPATVAQTLQELGYAGIGGGNYSAALVKELEARSLQFFNAYLSLSFAPEVPALNANLRGIIDDLEGHHSALWIAVAKVTSNGRTLAPSSTEGDEIAVAKLREIANYARPKGVRIALYPHTGMWLERSRDGVRLAKKVDEPTLVGATFNLCHFLKVEGDIDPEPALREAAPYLFFVSINGADRGDTRNMNWDRLIQTLDHGTYDVRAFLAKLQKIGYTGPVGFQGYGIKGDEKDNLSRTMEAWRRLSKP